MRRRFVTTLAALSLLAAPTAAWADDDVASQLRALQDRLGQLEDRLEATTDDLATANARVEEQQRLIESSGLAEGSASSGLASFIESVEMGGWISGSYVWNFENPDDDVNGGFNSGAVPQMPFKPDHNSFQVDQLWFEIEKPVSEDSRAGFRADIVYGKTAGILNGTDSAGGDDNDGFLGDELELYQAYIQYLAPVFGGTTFKFGKFGTLIGAEVAGARDNFNITRGHVYNLFEPITHTGILASTEFGGSGSLSLGLVNGTRCFDACDVDQNSNKAILWSIGWGWETVGVSFAGVHGDAEEAGGGLPAGDDETILDLIVSWDPSDSFSAYVNADYINTENSRDETSEFDGYGIAVAGRYAVSDRLGFSLRGEYAQLEADESPSMGVLDDEEFVVYGITGTVDYALTDDLMLKAELRYDDTSSSDDALEDSFFDDDGALTEDDQFVGAVEVIYTF